MLHYQRIRASSCARSATANLLLFHGIVESKSAIQKKFETVLGHKNRRVDHPSLLQIVQNYLPFVDIRWHAYRSFCFEKLVNSLTDTGIGLPTLLTFHMRHVAMDWGRVHCVVVMSADRHGVHIIDSLGQRGGHYPNGTICKDELPFGWPVIGAPLLVTKGPARLLTGLPSSVTAVPR
jgi:hypothetical protein